MKIKQDKNFSKPTDFSKLTEEELVEAFVFPSAKPSTPEEIKEDEGFWQQRREQWANRTPEEIVFSKLVQLKFQLKDYVGGGVYNPALNFGYFLKEYVTRQGKKDKQFAAEVDIKPMVLSQYINNHRKPTEKFVVRLEIHSNGLFNALTWFKLLQKDREHELMTNMNIRKGESKHVFNTIGLA